MIVKVIGKMVGSVVGRWGLYGLFFVLVCYNVGKGLLLQVCVDLEWCLYVCCMQDLMLVVFGDLLFGYFVFDKWWMGVWL